MQYIYSACIESSIVGKYTTNSLRFFYDAFNGLFVISPKPRAIDTIYTRRTRSYIRTVLGQRTNDAITIQRDLNEKKKNLQINLKLLKINFN